MSSSTHVLVYITSFRKKQHSHIGAYNTFTDEDSFKCNPFSNISLAKQKGCQ